MPIDPFRAELLRLREIVCEEDADSIDRVLAQPQQAQAAKRHRWDHGNGLQLETKRGIGCKDCGLRMRYSTARGGAWGARSFDQGGREQFSSDGGATWADKDGRFPPCGPQADPADKLSGRDELAATLRAGYRSIIVEADEWRPLADHVLALAGGPLREALARDRTDDGCPWVYCSDRQPYEAGRYEVALFAPGGYPEHPYLARYFATWMHCQEWSTGLRPEQVVYAWRSIAEDPPPLRPEDRAYLRAAGVPEEWLEKEG